MKITEVRADHYCVPLDPPLSDSTHGEMSTFGLVTARIRDADGNEGLGYTYTVNNIGAAAVRAVIEHDLTPELIGSEADGIEALWEKMWWRVHFVGRGGLTSFAMAAVDIALWDLRAKTEGQPLWKHLGGNVDTVAAYAGGIDLQLTIDELLTQTERFVAQGFKAIKMKVGRAVLSEDVERVKEIRDCLGEQAPLMIDANMRWTVNDAIDAARALRAFDVFWLEEPTVPEDVAGHARVAREGGIPVASGENLHSVHEFEDLIVRGGVSFPEPDAATLGGVTPWLRVAQFAQRHNLPVTSHGVHDIHVHLLASVPNASYLEVHGFGLERYMVCPLEFRGGDAIAPSQPGHGVDFDFEALESLRDGR